MSTEQVTPSPGLVRVRLQSPDGRWFTVGPLLSLSGARVLAEDMLAEGAVRAIRVEHRNRGTWRPAWGWLASACLLVLSLSGCATFKNTPQQDYVYAMAAPCEGHGVQISGVSPDGKSWRGSWSGGAYTWPEFQQCVREQMQARPYRQWLQGSR